MKREILTSAVILLICVFAGCDDENGINLLPVVPVISEEPAASLEEFEDVIDNIREDLLIPAVSAAIVKGDNTVWAKGFGIADIENNIPASPNTSYHLASLTKTFASTIIMQLVEEQVLDLQSPVTDFGVGIQSDGIVRVIHLLTHTSESSTPGEAYRYNGSRFALLDQVIERASGYTFAELLLERIIKPLDLEHTAPNIIDVYSFGLTGFNRDEFEENLAVGYSSDAQWVEGYPPYFGTSAGLISSVSDMAEYSVAIDNNMFYSEDTKEQVFSPTISTNGNALPYGLGWFVQEIQGVKIVWHYGWWTANSSLIIKVPERELAFIILANTDMLSAAYPQLGVYGDISSSVVAMEFINAFVFGTAELPDEPYDSK